MSTTSISEIQDETVEKLSSPDSCKNLYHEYQAGDPVPSGQAVRKVMELFRTVLFPGFYGISTVNDRMLKFQVRSTLENIATLLSKEIQASLCFSNNNSTDNWEALGEKASAITLSLIERLPLIRMQLASDVEAAYNGDPAADSYSEVICCYPIIRAITNYRIAHELYKADVPLIPRMLTENAHSETGMDIHPAAQIGHHFTIDHGTGVVIGATCIIGNNVKLYQGVTLGAKSFPLDENGNPIKGIPRHPILEDNVIVYSNATILGRVRIGHDAVIGGNIWVTEDVKPGTKLVQRKQNYNGRI